MRTSEIFLVYSNMFLNRSFSSSVFLPLQASRIFSSHSHDTCAAMTLLTQSTSKTREVTNTYEYVQDLEWCLPAGLQQREGNESAPTFNNSPSEEVGFEINAKVQSSFLIMLFPIHSVLFPKRFISCKGQKFYHKAILKGISSSVHNPEEHWPLKEGACVYNSVQKERKYILRVKPAKKTDGIPPVHSIRPCKQLTRCLEGIIHSFRFVLSLPFHRKFILYVTFGNCPS